MIVQIFEAQLQEKFICTMPPGDSETDGMLVTYSARNLNQRPGLEVGGGGGTDWEFGISR